MKPDQERLSEQAREIAELFAKLYSETERAGILARGYLSLARQLTEAERRINTVLRWARGAKYEGVRLAPADIIYALEAFDTGDSQSVAPESPSESGSGEEAGGE